ncbi:MAG: family ATPase [Sphingomonadales bacterium]|nr:family ATPase [Sphingomonadales bacterium]
MTTEPGPLTIVSLTFENVKRLKAGRIVPDGNTVVIAGRNGQGKTSILDCIALAFGGATAAKLTKRPVRKGQTSAFVEVDLGDMVVTRTWRDDDASSLKIESKDGARYQRPQELLDSIVGKLSFDPLAFAQLPPKEQRATLLRLVELPFDLDEMRQRRAVWYEERTDFGRDVKRLAAQVDGIPLPPADLPDEEVAGYQVMAEITEAQEVHAYHRIVDQEAARTATWVEDALATVARLERQLAEAREDLTHAQEVAAEVAADLAARPPLPDLEALQARLRNAEQTNQAVRQAARRRELAESLAAVKAQQEERTAWITDLDETVGAALAAAPLPLDGLTIVEDAVNYQDVPLAQASSAEQLRVSVAVAMALNPRVRVLRISDGSLLDSDNMRLIDEMAREHGFQVWVEKVDESGTVGITIEDGEVRS